MRFLVVCAHSALRWFVVTIKKVLDLFESVKLESPRRPDGGFLG